MHAESATSKPAATATIREREGEFGIRLSGNEAYSHPGGTGGTFR